MNIKKYIPTALGILGAGISFVGGMISNKRNQEDQIEAAREQARYVAKEESRKYYNRIEQRNNNDNDEEET